MNYIEILAGLPFSTPNPLVTGATEVKASHITELRTAINALRGHMGMPNHTWQYSTTTSDWISANPILEMRTALDAALGGPPPGGYSAGLAQGQLIKAIHIQELRDRVLASWNSGSSLQINWLVADHLGTPRIIVDKTGALANVRRHDYLPFGEELLAGTGGRTAALGYSGDNVRQKFTSKERDNETGLDYFLARYYSSTQGRFTSPDEFKDGPDELFVLGSGDGQKQALPYADMFNPQSLNKYQYCYNNPLRYVDPDGHDVWESLKGVAKEAANIFMEGSPLIAFPNGVSKVLTGEPVIRPFEAANQAQSKGMTAAAVGAVFAPGPGGKTRIVGRVLSTLEVGVIKTAKTILAKVLDTKTLQAAAREAAGQVVATKSTGVNQHVSRDPR